jgi:hypothetical protein
MVKQFTDPPVDAEPRPGESDWDIAAVVAMFVAFFGAWFAANAASHAHHWPARVFACGLVGYPLSIVMARGRAKAWFAILGPVAIAIGAIIGANLGP